MNTNTLLYLLTPYQNCKQSFIYRNQNETIPWEENTKIPLSAILANIWSQPLTRCLEFPINYCARHSWETEVPWLRDTLQVSLPCSLNPLLLWTHKDAQSLGAQDAQRRTVPKCTGRSKTQIQLCHDKMALISLYQDKFLTNFEGAEHKYKHHFSIGWATFSWQSFIFSLS